MSQNCCLLTTSLCCPMSMTSCKSLNSLRVYAHRKSLTVNTHKSEVMCFNSRSDNCLPPFYYDGTQLSYTDTFKYLDMMCDKSINLTTAADAALRPFTAGTFRVKKCVQENVIKQQAAWLLTYGSSEPMQFLLACTQARSGQLLSYNRAKRWTTQFRSGC